MPKIRIFDPKTGLRLRLPVPYRIFVNMFVRRSIILNILHGRIRDLTEEALRCSDDETQLKRQTEQQIVLMKNLYDVADGFDYGELRHALTNTSAYRGLVLVDVQAADGTLVLISL